jgi:hypothetical protein
MEGGIMIKTIKMLLEIQEENKYSDTMMAALLKVHHATYMRWKKRKTAPRNFAHLSNILKFLEEHQKESN